MKGLNHASSQPSRLETPALHCRWNDPHRTLYRSGFDPKDVVLIVTTVAGLAGYDQIKKKATEE